ncbi:TonB-dependent siderophore receptor [Emticicia oligotrophica]|uniref:TonB-dependent receptor plug domain-containing protein n=1 Tax=Emticicia oligotrophica TaxID=312279 RepID=UPI00273C7067|nr:TonB-dependent receptor [Emticicia oligotrophica]
MKYIYLLLLLPLGVLAQIDSTEKNISLNEVVVSGSKFEAQRGTIPNQISLISKNQIAFQNTPNTGDLLINSGNVFVQKSQGGGGSPVLRGFESSRVLVVVDGIRMNNAIYRAGHLQNVLRIDQSMLDRAEILFGPSSVIYGSDALGGVMSFKSKNPTLDKISASAYTRYSSAWNEKTVHADVNLGFKKFGSLTSITYSDFGDLIQGDKRTDKFPDFGKRLFYAERIDGKDTKVTNPDYNKQVGSGYSQYDILQKFMFQQSDKVKHTINLQYSNSSDVPRYDRLTEVSGTNPRFAEWYYGPEKRFLAAYHLELSDAKIYDKGMITAAFQDIEESRISRNFNNVNKRSQYEKVAVWTLNADFQKVIKANTIQYGAELTYNDVKSTATNLNISTGVITPSGTRYPDGKNTMQSLAVYLTDQLNISQKLYINAGLRYNSVSLKTEFKDKTFFPFPFDKVTQNPNALSGNLGVVARPVNKTKLSALFSSGFRSPNIDDMAKVFDSRAGTLIVPNPTIKPEYTYNYEATINQQIGEVLTIEATYFYTQFKNAIVTAPFTLNGQSTTDFLGVKSTVLASQNVREAQINGWNVAVYAKLTPDLIFSSTLNNTKGKIKDDKNTPLDHIPPMFGRTAIKFNKNKLQIEAFSLYNGWKKIADYNPEGEDNAQYATADGMPSWWTLNVRSAFQINKHLQIQAACENILDKNYRNFASGISNAGRNFIVTLRGNI